MHFVINTFIPLPSVRVAELGGRSPVKTLGAGL